MSQIITSSLHQRPGYLRAAQSHFTNENYEKHENSLSPQEDFSCFSFFSYPAQQRPQPAPAALDGPAGGIIRRLAYAKTLNSLFQ